MKRLRIFCSIGLLIYFDLVVGNVATREDVAVEVNSIESSDNLESSESSEKKQSNSEFSKNKISTQQQVVAIETPDDQIDNSIIVSDDGPSYDCLAPDLDWDRYSCDSARSIKQWMRWWRYLRLKTPVIMRWVNGFVLRIYPENEIFRAIFVRGIYDPNSMVVMKAFLPAGGVFVDVGASFGYFSIIASDAVGPRGHVIAIEPSSRDYSRLIDSVQLNNLENIISTYRVAISDRKGVATLKIATEERSALNTLGNDFSFKGVEKVATEEIRTVTLDEFVVANHIKRIDFLKLDIEGSELKALRGAEESIKRFKPAIMLGVNENALKASDTNHAEIQEMLDRLRYKAYKIGNDSGVFALIRIPDLTKESAKIVFCLPEDMEVPVLPQPKEWSVKEKICDFFDW